MNFCRNIRISDVSDHCAELCFIHVVRSRKSDLRVSLCCLLDRLVPPIPVFPRHSMAGWLLEHDRANNICSIYDTDLGETGYDKADSDSSDEYATTFQHHWFHSMSEIEFDDVKRNLRLNQLYSELRRQLCQIKQNKCRLPMLTKPFMKSLVDVARTRPADALQCVENPEEQRTTV